VKRFVFVNSNSVFLLGNQEGQHQQRKPRVWASGTVKAIQPGRYYRIQQAQLWEGGGTVGPARPTFLCDGVIWSRAGA
jgi:hypothetical protein